MDKKLKKKSLKYSVSKIVSFSNKGQGTKKYTISSAKKGKKSYKKYFKINKTSGQLTVKKKLRKGTYTVKIKVSAAGDSNHNSRNATVAAKIRVK